MEKIKTLEKSDIERLQLLAKQLDELQKKENNGRGVSCVQSVVAYLRMGRLDEARTICYTDHDKIDNYPPIMEFIKDNLFDKDEEHPWSVMERLQKNND